MTIAIDRLARLAYYWPTMSNIKDLTVAQLKQAIEIREQIAALEAQLATIGVKRLGRPPGVAKLAGIGAAPEKGRRRMSAAGRAAIAAAAKARWAKFRAGTGKVKIAGKKRKRFNAAARAKLSAAAKARWAKAKAAGKSAL